MEHSLQRVQESVEHTVLAIKTLPAGTQEQDAANAVEVMVQSDPLIMAGSLTSVVTPANPAESMIYIVQNKQGCKVSQLGGTSYNYTRQDWYLLPLKEKKPVWSTPYCESEAANTIMTTYSYPVKDAQNRITRIITADVSLHELAATTDSIRPYDASVTLLLNYSGGLIDPTDSLDVAGKFKDAPKFFAAVRQTLKGNSEFNNLHVDDTDYIATFTRVPEVQMVICTITPRQAVLAKFTNIRLPLLLFQGIALILLLVAIHFTVRRITRPLDRLTEAARSIGAGNLNTKIPPASSASDINGLRNAMASMQVSIKNLMEISARDAARMAKIEGELDIARKIQRGMLPGIAPAGGAPVAGGSLKIGALLEPARQVSGDLYDHIMVGGRLYLLSAM